MLRAANLVVEFTALLKTMIPVACRFKLMCLPNCVYGWVWGIHRVSRWV